MGLSCLFGHKWDGCTCKRCKKIRDEQHDWDLCKGICKRCRKRQPEQHDWSGCKCSRCDKTRDTGHKYEQIYACKKICFICDSIIISHNWNRCKCQDCGDIRNEEHDWNQCKCRICGKVRHSSSNNDYHSWQYIKENSCEKMCTICGAVASEYFEQESPFSGYQSWEEAKEHYRNSTAHEWDNGCVCKRCGAKRDYKASRRYPHPDAHTWNNCGCIVCGAARPNTKHIMDATVDACIVQCKVCGVRAFLAIDSPAHRWKTVNDCVKKCTICGIVVLEHKYQLTNSSKTQGDNWFSNEVFRCSRCGATAEASYTADRGRDSRESGILEIDKVRYFIENIKTASDLPKGGVTLPGIIRKSEDGRFWQWHR